MRCHIVFMRPGLAEPWFSMALDRLPDNSSTGPGGYLGLGELPPVAHNDDWVVAPVEITKAIPEEYYADGEPELTYWTISVDAVTWDPANSTTLAASNATANHTSFQAVVDSGNPLDMLPAEIAISLNSAFSPPAVFDEEAGIFSVECDARAPSYGVVIGGKTFWTDGRDMIIPNGDGTCISGVGATFEALGVTMNFLGDTFLKGVVSVWDFGKDEMRFAERVDEGTGGGNGAGSVGGDGEHGDWPPTSGASSLGGGFLWALGLLVGLTL